MRYSIVLVPNLLTEDLTQGSEVIETVELPDVHELFTWWLETSIDDYMAGAPKVDEYGAHDLEIMGAVLGVLAWGEHLRDVFSLAQEGHRQDRVSTELACWFYVLGKVSRLVSDYIAKRPGKDDTWHDITFYSMMARRIKETGRWP
jgi:hypothetical protein